MGEKGLIGFVTYTHSETGPYIEKVREAGYSTKCYIDVKTCIAHIEKNSPDIICVDMDLLPGFNPGIKDPDLEAFLAFRDENFRSEPFLYRRMLGLCVIGWLRERFPETPIIAIDEVDNRDLTEIPDFVLYDLRRRRVGNYLGGLCDAYINRKVASEEGDGCVEDCEGFLSLVDRLISDSKERIA